MKYKQLLISLLLTFPAILLAGEGGYVMQLQEEAERKHLWQKKEWLNLLHYREIGAFETDFESAVDDRSFFISALGGSDPKRELEATLAAFFKVVDNDSAHPQCRFVARFQWLSSQLNIQPKNLPAVDCKDYKAWRNQVRSEKVTLIFPAYHLNSPSSMFGHTLLRLDPKEGENWSDWLSFAVNFGANVNNSDNSMVYAYKGLMGGYPGQFIVMPYYKKILEYSRIERRDIWEYELDLVPEEVDRLVEHLWELKEINFDYYFFTENCSYRLLELLEVARPGLELTNEFAVTAIPVDTVRAVERAGMIENTEYRPSRETILTAMVGRLDGSERRILKALIEDPSSADDEPFLRLPEQRQQLLAETAYKLIRFRQNKLARDKEAARISHQLLSLINRYPTGSKQSIDRPVQPEKSHHSKQAVIKVGERDNKSYTELGFRMSFHSLEDNELGFLRGAQINIASISFRRSEEGSIFLQKLNFADIFSLTPRTEFFDPFSWRVRGGMERVRRDGRDRLVSHVSGGGGYAWNLGRDGIVYSFMTTRVEAGDSFKNYVEPALGVAAGFLLHNTVGTGRVELASEKFTGGQESTRLEYEQNIVLSRDQAIRLSLKREWVSHEQFSELGLSYQLHF